MIGTIVLFIPKVEVLAGYLMYTSIYIRQICHMHTKSSFIIIIIIYFGTTYLHGNSTIYYIIIIKYVTFLIYRKDSLHM